MATVYLFRQPKNPGQEPAGLREPSISALQQLPPSHTFNLRHGLQSEGLESNLIRFEAAAREKCLAAIEDLPDIKMEDWFIRLLDSRIIPALMRIGFDESFVRLLFRTAASGWQHMGPFPNKCTLFHPALIKNLKSVRNEMISKAGSQSDFSWIILPRIYHFLKEEHSAYLLCYLDHLSAEPESEFRRILTRIIIEFVGNYTLKYRSSILPRCLIDSALFYGYAAMFWKNLRNPPPGFEEDLIFNHCLRWIKLLRTKCADLNDDMVQSIKQMETYRQNVMLKRDPIHPGDDGNMDLGGLFVTLRHGRPGTEAAINFLSNWLYSAHKDPAGRSLSALLPAALNKLFHTIKIKLPVESPQVQQALRKFLLGLRDNFRSKGVDRSGNTIKPPEQFRFVVRRLLGVIDGMTASLT
jgi:hypothetical protein